MDETWTEESPEFAQLVERLQLKTDMGRKALWVSLQNVQTLDNKQLDYGSGNISAFGETGVLVRINDKLERLKNLVLKNKGGKARNEAVEDSYLDLGNYGVIGYMVHKGLWR